MVLITEQTTNAHASTLCTCIVYYFLYWLSGGAGGKGAVLMKCTKVPGTLAHTYANEHVCIFVWD